MRKLAATPYATALPKVVYDAPMPPYRFQAPDHGSGSAGQKARTVYSVGEALQLKRGDGGSGI